MRATRYRVAVAFAVAAFEVACSSGGGQSGDRQAGALRMRGQDAGPGDAVPVEVATLRTGAIEAVLRFSTNLTAERQVQVLARTTGLVRTLRVEEGDSIKRNQVLLRLEDDQQRLALERVANDLAQAQRELDRQQTLHERGVVSDQALQTAKYELTRLQLAKKDATLALRYTVVRAPLAGTLTRRMVKRGDTVSAAQPLFDITDFDSLVAQVFVPEKQLSELQNGQRARITSQARAGQSFVGTVERIAPTVDPNSGTVKVTIAVSAEPGEPKGQKSGQKEPAAGLMPGMFAEVELVTQTRDDAVLLPKRALVYDNDVPYAFVLDGDRVVRRRVDAALESRDVLEPASGFSAGDQVVIAGQVGLKDGALVTVAMIDGERQEDGDQQARAKPDGAGAEP